jgi:hypothetical protein
MYVVMMRTSGDAETGRGRSGRGGRCGFSLVEALVAAFILAAAFVPISGLIRDSFSQVSDQRMEAAAASYAAEVMNEWLFKRSYAQVPVGGPHVQVFNLPDGIVIRCEMWVFEVDPVPGGKNDMTFEYLRVPYHRPSGCPSGGEAQYPGLQPGDFQQPVAANLDARYQGLNPVPPLKTLHLMIQWRTRWEQWPAVGSPLEQQWLKTRTRHLITRRANLE